MKFLIKNITIFGIVAAIFSLSSCINEPFSNDPSHKLTFSRDTLSFDTLFSTIPSYTAEIMIYNRNNKALKISSVFLENGANSVFRFNLDGFVPNAANLLKVSLWDGSLENCSLMQLESEKIAATIPKIVIFFLK